MEGRKQEIMKIRMDELIISCFSRLWPPRRWRRRRRLSGRHGASAADTAADSRADHRFLMSGTTAARADNSGGGGSMDLFQEDQEDSKVRKECYIY